MFQAIRRLVRPTKPEEIKRSALVLSFSVVFITFSGPYLYLYFTQDKNKPRDPRVIAIDTEQLRRRKRIKELAEEIKACTDVEKKNLLKEELDKEHRNRVRTQREYDKLFLKI